MLVEFFRIFRIFADMKIIFLFDAIARMGGMERILTDKMNYFADVAKWEVHLITYQQGDHPFTFPLSKRVRHRDLGCRFVELYKYNFVTRMVKRTLLERRLCRRFAKTVEEIDPDVIACTTYHTIDMKALNKCKTRALKTIESHVSRANVVDLYGGGIIGRIRTWLEQCATAREVRKADVLIALTEQDAHDWRRDVRTVVIPNIVSHYPAKINYAADSVHAIAAGRLSRQKGFDMLIEAWRTVHCSHPEWMLDIYGRGEMEEGLNTMIADYGLTGIVTIYEPTEDIYTRYMESGLFILSSRYEGFGLVIIEAMACGLPVVAFNCPYGPMMIMGEDNEWLVEAGNVQTLAEKVICLIEHPEVRRQLSEVNREIARHYTAEAIMPMWERLYTTCREG